MRKFIFQSLKGVPTIMEVECKIISAIEDPSIMWLLPGEFKVEISSPTDLLTKKMVGKETLLVPTIYYSHSLYSSEEEAVQAAHFLIRKSIELRAAKLKIEFKEEEVLAEIAKLKIIKL